MTQTSKDLDAGFSLLETVIALFILAVTLLGLVGAGFTALRAAALGRSNSQAADVANGEIEYFRGLTFTAVTHSATDATLATAPGVSAGSYGGEPLEVGPGGQVTPVTTTKVSGKTSYTVRRYVTRPPVATTTASGLPTVRRLTVVVSWTQRDRVKTRAFSTLLTSTRRGLPLPNYRFDYNGAGSKNGTRWRIERAPGAQADFGLRLSNLGARDAWEITATTSGWSYYLDVNANGIWDGSPAEPALADTNGNGSVDTGLLEPNAPSYFFVASRATQVTESGSQNTDFLAASAAQPTVAAKKVLVTLAFAGTAGSSPSPQPSGTPTPTPTPTSGTPGIVCTPGTVGRTASTLNAAPSPPGGFTNVSLKLFNGTGQIDGDSTTQEIGTMGANGVNAPGDCNYSTEQGAGLAGRATTATAPGRWEYSTTAATDEFRGLAQATIWVQCPTAGTKLTFSVLKKTTSNNVAVDTTRGSTVVNAPANCDAASFIAVQAVIDVGAPNGNGNDKPSFAVAASTSERLVLKVSPDKPVRLLYEAPNSQAALMIPTK